MYGGVESPSASSKRWECGCAFFDYDNDGWMDIFLLSGTRLDGDPQGATNRLYKNNRDGTFTDVLTIGAAGRGVGVQVVGSCNADSRTSSARSSGRTVLQAHQ